MIERVRRRRARREPASSGVAPPPWTLHAIALVATLAAIATIWLTQQSWERSHEIALRQHSLEATRSTIDALRSDLLVAESSQRGYWLSGNARLLATYHDASNRIVQRTRKLDDTAPASIGNTDIAAQFVMRLNERLQRMEAVDELLSKHGPPGTPEIVHDDRDGPDPMVEFQAAADRLVSLVDTRTKDARAQLDQLQKTSRTALIICILLAWMTFMLYAQQRQRLHEFNLRRRAMLERRIHRWESVAQIRAEKLSQLATYLQRVTEDERARLARELHDELGALMTAAKFDVARLRSRLAPDNAAAISRLEHLSGLLNESIALGRRIIEGLRPSSLAHFGLASTLSALAHDWQRRTGVSLQVSLDEIEIDADRQLTAYRLVQEALTNISRYASATAVSLTLKAFQRHVVITIVDNGIGFDTERVSASAHGLAGMRHRLEAVGGSLVIISRPGQGARLVGTIPLEEPADKSI